MSLLSSLTSNLLGPATNIPCVCPVRMLDQLKKLIPPLPALAQLPAIPVPNLDALAPIATAAPTPANNFVSSRLDVINNMRIPPALQNLQKLDPVKLGQLESAAPLLRTLQRATGMKIDDPKLSTTIQGSLLALAKIPLAMPTALPPPPPPLMQKLSTAVTQMRMAQTNLPLKLVPLDPKTLAKIQTAARAVAALPPYPADKLAPLAPLATLARVASAMGVNLTKPGAMTLFSEKLATIAKLPPPPPVAALPAVMNLLSAAQVYQNTALFFKLDLAKLTPQMLIAKVGVPLQPLVTLAEQLNSAPPLTPAQAANANTWVAAANIFPALQLMQTFDLARLDLAPLENLPDLSNAAAINNAMTLGEAAQSAAGKSAAPRCPQCPLA